MNAENYPTQFPQRPQRPSGSTEEGQHRCAEIVALVPAHSIGATDATEAALVDSHLAECPTAEHELAAYHQLAERLLYSAPATTAPPQLATRLQAAIGVAARPQSVLRRATKRPAFLRKGTRRPLMKTHPTQPPLPATMANYRLRPDGSKPFVMPASYSAASRHPAARGAPPRAASSFGRYISWTLAAAAAIVLIVTNVALVTQNQQLRYQQEVMANTLTQQSRALILLAAEQPQEVAIYAPDGHTTAQADILWNGNLRLAVVYVRDFPPCEAGMKYQLWLTKNGQKSSGGLFSVDASGMGLLVMPLEFDLDTYEMVGITPEPAAGSVGPTAPPVVVGEL